MSFLCDYSIGVASYIICTVPYVRSKNADDEYVIKKTQTKKKQISKDVLVIFSFCPLQQGQTEDEVLHVIGGSKEMNDDPAVTGV